MISVNKSQFKILTVKYILKIYLTFYIEKFNSNLYNGFTENSAKFKVYLIELKNYFC